MLDQTKQLRGEQGSAIGPRLALFLAMACALAAWVTGCASTRPGSVPPGGRGAAAIQELSLLSAPAALNFDGVPGADGVSLRVYAGNPREPKCLPMLSGTLEILLFDGVVTAEALPTARPLHVWKYPADDLLQHGQKTSLGISYVFTPLWGKDKPTQNRATLAARYLSPQGGTIWTAPAVIFVPGS